MEARFVREGNLVEPLEDVKALALSAVQPLRCVVVRVDEARDEQLPVREASDGQVGWEMDGGEDGRDVVDGRAGPEGRDDAAGFDDEEGVLEDGKAGWGCGVDDVAVEGLRRFGSGQAGHGRSDRWGPKWFKCSWRKDGGWERSRKPCVCVMKIMTPSHEKGRDSRMSRVLHHVSDTSLGRDLPITT